MKSIHVAYFVGTHQYSFRALQAAEIIGVRIVEPEGGGSPRPCFELRYADGAIDYSPIWPSDDYEIGDLTSIQQELSHGHDQR